MADKKETTPVVVVVETPKEAPKETAPEPAAAASTPAASTPAASTPAAAASTPVADTGADASSEAATEEQYTGKLFIRGLSYSTRELTLARFIEGVAPVFVFSSPLSLLFPICPLMIVSHHV